MIKYIYYRICKDWERKWELNQTKWGGHPYYWCGLVYFLLFFPLAMLGAVLMDSSNSSSFVMVFFPIMVLAVYFAYRFDKKMRSYLPPERYETFDYIPVYRLRILLDILLIVWAIGGTLLLYYIVFSFNLNGWLYNLLFHQI